MKIFKDVLAALFGSKKFVAMLVGLLVWFGGKLGLKLSEADLYPAVALIASYILGQGAADFGKEAARAKLPPPVPKKAG